MLWISISILLARILVGFISFPAGTHMRGAFFSITVQIFCLFLIPLVIYCVMLRQPPQRIMTLSGFKRTSPIVLLLSVVLGIICLFVMSGIYNAWMMLLEFVGYNPNAGAVSGTPIPTTWSNFVIAVFISAVLPGFCEEFATRGVVLDSTKRTFNKAITIILLGLAFGLIHQNIRQFLFTSLMGMLLVYLTIELKSIWPAIIIHFFNNLTSLYVTYATGGLGLPFGSRIRAINLSISSQSAQPLIIAVGYLGAVVAFFGLIYLMVWLSKKRTKKQRNLNIIQDNKDADEIQQGNTDTTQFKLSLRDNAAYIGAIVTTTAATIFSFLWGVL